VHDRPRIHRNDDLVQRGGGIALAALLAQPVATAERLVASSPRIFGVKAVIIEFPDSPANHGLGFFARRKIGTQIGTRQHGTVWYSAVWSRLQTCKKRRISKENGTARY
jgi:hypothetical protein